MKRTILIIALCFFALALQAEPNRVSYSRTITKFGGTYTVGDVFSMDNLGCGLATMKYKFFDPFTPGGIYYGLGGADVKRTFGGVSIGDLRPVTIGWRKEIAGPLGFDTSFSPVLGSRIVDNSINASFFLGVKPMIGAFLAINENIDIELAYEPMIHILNLCGPDVSDKTSHDLSLYVVLKKFSLTQKLGWYSKAP